MPSMSNLQLELIYIAYFNRAGDIGGFSFWEGQNVQAQAAGQSAALALTNIANSFTPQPETYALYPFLATPNLNLNSPAGQAGLTTFINSVYENLFSRAPDATGRRIGLGRSPAERLGLERRGWRLPTARRVLTRLRCRTRWRWRLTSPPGRVRRVWATRRRCRAHSSRPPGSMVWMGWR